MPNSTDGKNAEEANLQQRQLCQMVLLGSRIVIFLALICSDKLENIRCKLVCLFGSIQSNEWNYIVTDDLGSVSVFKELSTYTIYFC